MNKVIGNKGNKLWIKGKGPGGTYRATESRAGISGENKCENEW